MIKAGEILNKSIEKLKNNDNIDLRFIKVNGTIRSMKCYKHLHPNSMRGLSFSFLDQGIIKKLRQKGIQDMIELTEKSHIMIPLDRMLEFKSKSIHLTRDDVKENWEIINH